MRMRLFFFCRGSGVLVTLRPNTAFEIRFEEILQLNFASVIDFGIHFPPTRWRTMLKFWRALSPMASGARQRAFQGIWGSETRWKERSLASFLPRPNLHKGACGYEVIRRGIRSFLVVGE